MFEGVGGKLLQIAETVKKLQVALVVRTAKGKRHPVVNVRRFFAEALKAPSAFAFLLNHQFCDIGRSMSARRTRDPSAPRASGTRPNLPTDFDVAGIIPLYPGILLRTFLFCRYRLWRTANQSGHAPLSYGLRRSSALHRLASDFPNTFRVIGALLCRL